MSQKETKQTATGFSTIQRDETFMETISHGTSDYSFKFYDETMDMFDFRCIDWHWHAELEIVFIEKGSVDCFIGTEQVVVSEGTVLFINTKKLHKLTSGKNAVIPNFLFLPSFIAPEESLLYKKYIAPVLQSAVSFTVFTPHENAKIVQMVKEIIAIQKQEKLLELFTYQKMTELWSLIYQELDISQVKNLPASTTRSYSHLQLMMQFIHQNYEKPIQLEDIAASGNVSKSTALTIFKTLIKDTPVNYLLKYRLQRAAVLLKTTEKKIDYIAQNTGFVYESYFNRRFKQFYGITPGQYRKNYS